MNTTEAIKNIDSEINMEVLETVETPGWQFWAGIGTGTLIGAGIGAIIVT